MKKSRTRGTGMTEVAKRAGVSLSTVSRALAGNPLISEKTRRKVEKVAESLEYRVDAAGSSLRTGLTRTAGVVIPLTHAADQRFSDPFFLEMVGAIADELSAVGYSMLLSKLIEDPSAWIRTALRERRTDGIIVIGQSLHHASLNELALRDFPLVVWGARREDQSYASVGSDNAAGAELATAHLLSQGCRDIVFLGDPALPEVAARLEGYAAALKAAGLRRRSRLEIAVGFGDDSACQAVASLLAKRIRFDGILASSDSLAMRAMRTLNERGRRVPADVAVVGFDDIPFTAFTTPALSTVRQDVRLGAQALVRNLMRVIARLQTDSVVVPTELVIRGSSRRSDLGATTAVIAPRSPPIPHRRSGRRV
jgi:DNA-binding LacI/PurR family transcriptional regulator